MMKPWVVYDYMHFKMKFPVFSLTRKKNNSFLISQVDWQTLKNVPQITFSKFQTTYKLTFKTLERFEDFDEWLCGELFVVLGGDVDADLQILADVGLQHGLDALQRVLYWQRAEVVNQPVRIQEVGVHHRALDVVQICVVLQCLPWWNGKWKSCRNGKWYHSVGLSKTWNMLENGL